MSFLSTLGADVKKVFDWLGSSKGQAVIAAGEGVVESVYPPATGIINLANTWLSEIIKSEGLAAGAAAQTGTGVQKAAIAINAVTPQAIAFAAAHGLPAPDAEAISKANDALVAFLNAFGSPAKG
jgi:hypothetical protein